MADAIVQLPPHPLSSTRLPTDLAIVFECENPFLMDLHRFEELIRNAPPGELRGYLFGLYDQRRVALYSGSPQ